ncbi:MAG: prepilin-type N-terminal cleavage/methylation domain-containing protein [Candidatus Omnitrophica bacterium]|nr:prepilin-type N-terminal cleavage/methylation domain-containing protein [Candidatus Omnitrophota bacterium]
MSYRTSGVTLTEILTVIIIIAILAALALPQFATTRERALSKEAKANLKIIDAAEKIYRMEVGFYYPYSGSKTDPVEINSDLKLSVTENNWDYAISGGSGSSYVATADRQGSGGYSNCVYTVTDGSSEPTPNAYCTD